MSLSIQPYLNQPITFTPFIFILKNPHTMRTGCWKMIWFNLKLKTLVRPYLCLTKKQKSNQYQIRKISHIYFSIVQCLKIILLTSVSRDIIIKVLKRGWICTRVRVKIFKYIHSLPISRKKYWKEWIFVIFARRAKTNAAPKAESSFTSQINHEPFTTQSEY